MDRLKILAVDDTAAVRMLVRQAIEKGYPGAEVDEASNGRDAEALVQRGPYHLIVCGGEMPVPGGGEFVHWLRGRTSRAGTPFIMLTSRGDKEFVVRALDAGVNALLLKPFSAEQLLGKVASVLGKSERRAHERLVAGDAVTLRCGQRTLDGALVDISLGGLLATFPVAGGLPPLLEPVTLDIRRRAGPGIAGLHGFVVRLEAAQPQADCTHGRVAVKFGALSQELSATLAQFLLSLRD